MKKIFIGILMIGLWCSAFSQKYVSGSFSIRDEFKSKKLHVDISPEFGYLLNEKSAVGGELSLLLEKDYRTVISFLPYYRYFVYSGKVKLFVDGLVGVTMTIPKEGDNATGMKIGFVPGLEYDLNEKWGVISKFGFLGYYQPDEDKRYVNLSFDVADLKLGVIYRF